METSAVIQLYERSVEKHSLFYNPFIGGYISPYRELCKINAYDLTKLTEKEEDVEHVIKRKSSQLRTIVHDYKGNRIISTKL